MSSVFAERYALWWLLLVGGFLRIAAFLVGDNAGGDAGVRAIMAFQSEHFVDLFHGGSFWLPLHFVLMKFCLWLYPDPFIAPRLLSLLLGVLSLFCFFKLLSQLFAVRVAILSTWLLVLMPAHIAYSTVSSSELLALCLLLAGLCFLVRAFNDVRWRDLFFAAACFLLLTWVRYELWLLVCLGLLFFWMPDRSLKQRLYYVMLFMFIVGLGPLAWMAYLQDVHGDALAFLATLGVGSNGFSSLALSFFPLFSLLILMTPMLALWALGGIRLCCETSQGRCYFGLSLMLFLLMFVLLIKQSIAPQYRYFLLVSVLFLPLAALFAYRFYGRLMRMVLLCSMLLMGALTLAYYHIVPSYRGDALIQVSPVSKYMHEQYAVRDYLQKHAQASEPVMFIAYLYVNQLRYILWQAGWRLDSLWFAADKSAVEQLQAVWLVSAFPLLHLGDPVLHTGRLFLYHRSSL